MNKPSSSQHESSEVWNYSSAALFRLWKLIFLVIWTSLFSLGYIFVVLMEKECLRLCPTGMQDLRNLGCHSHSFSIDCSLVIFVLVCGPRVFIHINIREKKWKMHNTFWFQAGEIISAKPASDVCFGISGCTFVLISQCRDSEVLCGSTVELFLASYSTVLVAVLGMRSDLCTRLSS